MYLHRFTRLVVADLERRRLHQVARGGLERARDAVVECELRERTASMTIPAEFGESHTSSLSSQLSGTSPNAEPSMRMYAHLRSESHGTKSDGPTCTFPRRCRSRASTSPRWSSRSSWTRDAHARACCRKSEFPPTFSCIVRSRWTPRSPKSVVRTRWVMVAPTCDLMSSPMIGTPALLEALLPVGLARDEHGHAVHHRRHLPRGSARSTTSLLPPSRRGGS